MGKHYRLSTIASMEAYANNRDGKPQPSKLDFAVCRWINQPVPKIASKVEQPDQKTATQPQTVVLQAAARQTASDGLERKQCRQCGEMVALINGEYPRICRFCGQRPAGEEVSDAEGAEIAAAIDRAVASGEPIVDSEKEVASGEFRVISEKQDQQPAPPANKQRDGRGRFIAPENKS